MKYRKPTLNHYKPWNERKVMWGKYAGTKFVDVPTDYLIWFCKNALWFMENRYKWACEELNRRGVKLPKHNKFNPVKK